MFDPHFGYVKALTIAQPTQRIHLGQWGLNQQCLENICRQSSMLTSYSAVGLNTSIELNHV